MKLTKLPTAKIPETYPSKKFSLKSILVALVSMIIVIVFSVMAYGIIVVFKQNAFLQSKAVSMMSSPQTNSVVVLATSKIITREGSVSPQVAQKYAMWVYESAAQHGVDPILILAVMSVESKFDFRAISPTGPIGLLQVAWSWHKEKSSKDALFDPKTNINVGTQILKEYRNISSTEVESLLRYNGSLGAESPKYAIKVLQIKSKFEKEILTAVAESI